MAIVAHVRDLAHGLAIVAHVRDFAHGPIVCCKTYKLSG